MRSPATRTLRIPAGAFGDRTTAQVAPCEAGHFDDIEDVAIRVLNLPIAQEGHDFLDEFANLDPVSVRESVDPEALVVERDALQIGCHSEIAREGFNRIASP